MKYDNVIGSDVWSHQVQIGVGGYSTRFYKLIVRCDEFCWLASNITSSETWWHMCCPWRKHGFCLLSISLTFIRIFYIWSLDVPYGQSLYRKAGLPADLDMIGQGCNFGGLQDLWNCPRRGFERPGVLMSAYIVQCKSKTYQILPVSGLWHFYSVSILTLPA